MPKSDLFAQFDDKEACAALAFTFFSSVERIEAVRQAALDQTGAVQVPSPHPVRQAIPAQTHSLIASIHGVSL